MKTKHLSILLSVLIFLVMLSACGKPLSKEEKEARLIEQQIAEVMAIHDSVMPKTGEIFKLKKKLSGFETNVKDSLLIQKIYRYKNLLEEADDAMMDWMHEFREADPMLTFEEKQQYYSEEKMKITEVKIKMLASIDSAKTLLNILETDAK